MGREEFVHSLPLPLAQLWVRAHDTASGARQSAVARDLLEVAIRLRALAERSGTPEGGGSLAAAWAKVRAAEPFFGSDIAQAPHAAALGAVLGVATGTVGDVVDRALAAKKDLPAAPLLSALGEILRGCDVLAGRRLLYACDGACYELLGETPRAIAEPGPGSARAPIPLGVVSLVGPAGDVADLDAVARFDPETVEFFLLAGGEWQCHSTGARRKPTRHGSDTPTIKAGSPRDHATRPRTEERTPERRRMGEFALLSRIGAGGMGIVYRAWQPSLGRAVAVKCLRGSGDDKSLVRFDREIRALGRVEHPNLVKIFTSGQEGDEWYYAMELVEGADLERIGRKLAEAAPASEIGELQWRTAISRATTEAEREEQHIAPAPAGSGGARPPSTSSGKHAGGRAGEGHVERSAELVRQVAGAAHALHEAGLVHRDIKPGNVIVSASGTHATLMDLGLVRSISDPDESLTRTQQFVGTLRYASPEQLLGDGDVGRASDVYSLGVTLYELLTLRPVYGADNSTPTPVVIERILNEEATSPRKLNPCVPRDLEAIVMKCLAKEPARRYATAEELADDIERWQAMEPVRAKRDGIVGRLARQGRRLSVVHPWIFTAAVVAFAFAGTVAFLEVGGQGQRYFDRVFGTTLRSWLHSSRTPAAWEEMAIVAFDDRSLESLPGLAERLGVAGVDPKSLRTLRPLHGALMKRLAAARPAVVVWDYVFDVADPRFDGELAAGIDALRAAGTRVVLGVMGIDASGAPVLASGLRSRCDGWGWILLAQETIDGGYVTGGCLVTSLPPFELSLGLPLAAYIAYRHPGCYQRTDFAEQNLYLDLHCGMNCPNRAEDDSSAGGERILFADVQPGNPKGIPQGIDPSKRRVACAEVGFPGRELIASRTVSYADLFAASDADLASRFGGKVVFVGEGRKGLDRHVIDRSGREESGVVIHAATTGDLIAGVAYSRHGLFLEYLLLPAFAGLALMLLRSSPFASIALRSAAAFGGMVALSCVATAVAAGAWRILLSPTELVVVSFLAIAAAAALHGGSATALIPKTPSTVEGRNGSTRRTSP